MNVVNFGSLNLDHVYAVDHFCRAGETIHTAGYTQNAGGKGLNQSIAVARSGQALCHAGMLGAGGEPLAQLLEGCGVDLRYLGRTETPQGHAIIQVQPDGQNCIFLYGGSNQAVTPEDIDAVLSHFAPGDYLLMQNELSNFTYLLRAAVGRGLRVVLNASPISGEVLAADLTGVDWLVVNEIECAAIAGCSTAEEGYAALRARYPGLGILLTLSSVSRLGLVPGAGDSSPVRYRCRCEPDAPVSSDSGSICFPTRSVTQISCYRRIAVRHSLVRSL